MLFNPTPLERLTTLTTEFMERHSAVQEELEALRAEVSELRAHEKSKDDEISQLTAELSAKDVEIEAIVTKIESLLG